MQIKLMTGDSLHKLKELEDNSVHSIVSDPPYGLGKEPDPVAVMTDWCTKGFHEVKSKGGFMGKEWDSFVPQPILFKEALRVLKPGGYALIACGTRTEDWMAMSLRFAGFEIRDVICWHYGSGFPKSLDVSKAIDKEAEAEREVVCAIKNPASAKKGTFNCSFDESKAVVTAPATDEAKKWEGWGTALKPATEFWILARKPLTEGTVAQNVLAHGTGGINVDGCRIPTDDKLGGGNTNGQPKCSEGWDRPWMHDEGLTEAKAIERLEKIARSENLGRWPANVVLDEFMAEVLDEQTGILKSGKLNPVETTKQNKIFGKYNQANINTFEANEGGASRFFYCAKTSKADRNEGLEGFKEQVTTDGRNKPIDNAYNRGETQRLNNHPTVKPTALMRWLVKLITPPGGVCIDPFNGSGSTGKACALEDFNYIGIEREPEYIGISAARIAAVFPDVTIDGWDYETYKILS